ncbi:MAG: glycosyltransferase family 4 protein [Flavobacteriales bacterium]
MSKKKVIVFSDWFVPGYKAGGPIKSLKNLIDAVDADFHVFTRITDYHSGVSYPNVEEGKKNILSKNCSVTYFNENRMNVRSVFEILKNNNFDRIYLNSLFSIKFTIFPLLVCRTHGLNDKVIVAPRGMLKSGALTIKPWKKAFFLRFCRFLYRGVTWHATNEQEAIEIKSKFPSSKVVVAPVIPSADEPMALISPKIKGVLRVVCFSRVSAEKGILEAIRSVNSVRSDRKISFDIYGAIPKGEYAELCFREAALSSRVRLMGEVEPPKIKDIYANYEVFFLPTWGENYGHAIAEALLSGKPAIISNKTPWRKLKESQAGVDIEPSTAAFVEALELMCDFDQGQYEIWSNAAKEYALKVLRNPEVMKANTLLFE